MVGAQRSATFRDRTRGACHGCRGTARETSTGYILVHWVRSGQIPETLVQVERAVRPSSSLLIRGFGVRVPGGAPVFALARRHAALCAPEVSGPGPALSNGLLWILCEGPANTGHRGRLSGPRGARGQRGAGRIHLGAPCRGNTNTPARQTPARAEHEPAGYRVRKSEREPDTPKAPAGASTGPRR